MNGFKGYRERLGLTRAQLSRIAEVEIACLWLLEDGFEDKVPREEREKIVGALDNLLLARQMEKLKGESSN